MTNAILLASGGLDSTTLAFWLRERGVSFLPLFINYGQHCAETEWNTLGKVLPSDVLDKLEQVDISDIYRGSKSRLIDEPDLWDDEVSAEDLYLPYRNLLVLSVGAALAQSRGIPAVYAAFINANHAKEIDCSVQFFDQLDEILVGYGTIKVQMPFKTLSKVEVARIGLNLRVPVERTFSCQAASVTPCGACPNCVDRLDALRQLTELPQPDSM